MLACDGLFWTELGSTGFYRAVLGSTELCWTLMDCTGSYWALQKASSILSELIHRYIEKKKYKKLRTVRFCLTVCNALCQKKRRFNSRYVSGPLDTCVAKIEGVTDDATFV